MKGVVGPRGFEPRFAGFHTAHGSSAMRHAPELLIIDRKVSLNQQILGE